MKKRKWKFTLPRINLSKLRLRLRRTGISALHALFMILFLFLWLRQDMSLALESTFLKWQAQISNTKIVKSLYDRRYSADDAIFIDVSASREIAFDSGALKKEIITNRRTLDTILRSLHSQGEYKFILCDLYFDIRTGYDSILDSTIRKTKRIGFPLTPPKEFTGNRLQNLPGGVVRYSYIGNFYKLADEMVKFRLVDPDGEKSLPLVMAESIEKTKLTKTGAFLSFDNKPHLYLNNMIVDDHINNANLLQPNGASGIYTPEDIIMMLRFQDAATLSDIFKNKIIVIGDMATDRHNTAYGEMAGSMILFNIFLSLANDENTITFWWIAYLFVMFTALSYFIFYRAESRIQHVVSWIKVVLNKLILGELLSDIVTNTIFLFIISLLSYFIFKKNIELLALSVWLSLLEYVIGRVKAKDEWFKRYPVSLRSIINFLLINKPDCK